MWGTVGECVDKWGVCNERGRESQLFPQMEPLRSDDRSRPLWYCLGTPRFILLIIALIEDLIRGIASGFGLFGDFDGSFEGSATQRQIAATEVSTNNLIGTNFGVTQQGRDAREMATGGIVTGPTTALIGEAGPEAVIPLSGNAPALKVDNKETNDLLKIIAGKLTTVDMYEVQ